MQTKTFTLLLTIRDDGCAGVMNRAVLAAAIEGALENGIKSFMLDSVRAAAANVNSGEHRLPPVVSAVCHAVEGDQFFNSNVDAGTVAYMTRVSRLHANLRP